MPTASQRMPPLKNEQNEWKNSITNRFLTSECFFKKKFNCNVAVSRKFNYECTECTADMGTHWNSILQFLKPHISKSKTCFENLVPRSLRWHLDIEHGAKSFFAIWETFLIFNFKYLLFNFDQFQGAIRKILVQGF